MAEHAVAVRIGLRHQPRAERAAGAGTILDHDGLTEFCREMIEY